MSSAGLTEDAYRRVTYEMTFSYVSGAGTDSTEHGRVMWARVKGATENALLRLPFKAVYLFRPGAIQPLHGIQSSTKLYRALYRVMGPFFPVLKALFPDSLTTTEQLGRAMLHAGLEGAPKAVLETRDINRL